MGALLDIARKAAGFTNAPASGEARALPDQVEGAFDSEYFAERAAIREFDGGFSRQEAERLAMRDLLNKHCGTEHWT